MISSCVLQSMDLTAEEGSGGSSNVTPVTERISPFCCIGSDLTTKAVKRANVVQERRNNYGCSSGIGFCDGMKRRKLISGVRSPSDVFSCENWNEGVDLNKYGSVSKDIEALIVQRKSYLMANHETTPTSAVKQLNVEKSPSKDLRAENTALTHIVILDDDDDVRAEEFHQSAVSPVSINKQLNEEKRPSEDLGAENAALPHIIILDDGNVQTEEFRQPAMSPVVVDLEDEDFMISPLPEVDVPAEEFPQSAMCPVIINLENEDFSMSPLLEVDTITAVNEILIENVDIDCAQDQWLRKENFCSAGETEKKERVVDLGVEAEDGKEDMNGQSDANCESHSKNTEVNQDAGVYLGVETANEMEQGNNEQTVPSCEGLPKISEISVDEVINLGLNAAGGMEEHNGQTGVNCGSLPKVSELSMDKNVDLAVEVANGIEEGNGQADANYECLAKIPEIDESMVLGLEAKVVMEEDNWQTAANCENPAKISKFNKEKGVYVSFKDDEEVEEGNGRRDSSSDALLKISKINKDKGVYVGVEDDEVEEDNGQLEAGSDDVANIWNEMAVALECSKDTAVDSMNEKYAIEDAERCEHSFVLKEDIGYVCRICGLVDRAIETIIEFQYAKAKKSGRTYRYEGSSGKDLERANILQGVKLADHDYSAFELTAHPRHRKLMKPHQVEGFNFLLSNLVTDNPGGCILAHAPGSGKTFMIISFLQSFMAKYPAARPLIVMPRGILSTWKKEFKRWQVEDIPLYDFYSSKAESRSQQLKILQHWVSERSILFLGYKQFSTIVCDSNTSKIASECAEILLTGPSILILDEGHTPRNQETDILKSLEKVQTPRKVVLSGTLYQNHVEEVFTVLNLVRPRFLKLNTSKTIKRRIMSRVQMSGRKSSLKKFSNDDFYQAVECTLLKDESFNRKVTVIQDLRAMTSKVLHYYKGDSLDELPGLVDFTIFLELSPRLKGEVTELKKMKNRFKRNSDGSNIYVHPLLKTLSVNSAMRERVDDHKIDLILEKLDVREGVKAKFYLNLLHLCESSGEKLLVFSQYLLPLKFLERLTAKVMGYRLEKEIFMITGDSDSDLRDSYMEQFNNSSVARVFFGSIKACGEGISLVGASRIIVLDVHLNPSVTRQAIGRAFRPGQVRKVYAYRLVASDSPEVDDHLTCFRKETISKLWFEWNGCLGEQDFEMETVNVKDSGDLFLESPLLSQDVISVFKR